MRGIYHYINEYHSRHLHNVEHVTFVSFHNSIDMQTEFPEYYEKKRLYSLYSHELYSCTICLPTILLIAKLLSYLFENFHDTRNNHLLHFCHKINLVKVYPWWFKFIILYSMIPVDRQILFYFVFYKYETKPYQMYPYEMKSQISWLQYVGI